MYSSAFAGHGASSVQESIMKLPVIAVSVVIYTVLALAWIVYAGLTPLVPVF